MNNEWSSVTHKPRVNVVIEVMVCNSQGKDVLKKGFYEEDNKIIGWQVQGSAGLYWRYLDSEVYGWRYMG